MEYVEYLLGLYQELKKPIRARIAEFKEKWHNAPEEELYLEAVFCLLTPQSKALSCWEAVKELKRRRLIFSQDKESVAEVLRGKVRFHNTKACNVVELRKIFVSDGKPRVRKVILNKGDPCKVRRWLVKNVRGYGYKEATHFFEKHRLLSEWSNN